MNTTAMQNRYFKKLKKTLAHFFHPRQSNNHRARLLHPESLVYIGIIAIGVFSFLKIWSFFPLLHDNILGFASDITAEQVIVQTNQQRKQLGLSELTYNEELSQAALAKGQDMFSNQYWSHVSPQGRQPWDFIKEADYVYIVAGENLARDFSHTDEMVGAWMASPTHKANIINPKFQEIGIAVIDGKLKGFETTLVVQMFGTKSTQVAQVGNSGIEIETESPVEEQAVIIQENAIDTTNSELGRLDVRADKEFVLSGLSELPDGGTRPALFNPLQITKAFFLVVILLILSTLVYDGFIAGRSKIERVVGKNFAHILLFGTVTFLLLLFKGGVIQ